MGIKQPNGPARFPDGVGTVLWREWGTEVVLVACEHYTLKKIMMRPQTVGGLQYHHKKDEAGWVIGGVGVVEYDKGNGQLSQISIRHGSAFRFPAGAVHRVSAGPHGLTYIEVSTPHFNDRCHVEAEYGLSAETGGLPSTKPEDVTTVPPGSGVAHEVPGSDTGEGREQAYSREEYEVAVRGAINAIYSLGYLISSEVERVVREYRERKDS